MPVACEARWDICAFRRGLGFRCVWAVCSGGILSPLSLSWCYTELGQGGLQFTAIAITPLSLSWCYTEFGQGRGTLRSNPLSLSWCYTEFGQGRGTLRSNPLSLSWCYTEFGQGRGTLRTNPLSLSWCYTELRQGRAVGLGDDHRRGGRFIALRVLGFGFRARVKGLGSSV